MFKRLALMIVVAGAGLAAWNAAHPNPLAADSPPDSTDAVDSTSFSARVSHRVSVFGTSIAQRQIRASVDKTQRQLALMAPMVRKTAGLNGTNALIVSKKITQLDSLSLASLDAFHPVTSIRLAMSARSYIDLVRQDISDEVASR